MKLIPCPLNGLRNVDEFAYGGEVSAVPAPDASDESWIQYIFARRNPAGFAREWWFHVPSAFWFILERDTVTGAVLRSYTVEQFRKEAGGVG